MSKKGLKVKDLARELGVTSRQIIERGRADGLPIQNSITRLSPDQEQMVRASFARQGAGVQSTPAEPDA